MMRIISLIPSATEIICALGFENNLVGRSHECDTPPAITALPACTAPKFDPNGTSREIDERVQALLQEALSVYRVDTELLAELRPDVIVTQAQCEVCAVSLDEVKRVAAECLTYEAKIISLEPNYLEDVLNDIERVGQALEPFQAGTVERAHQLVMGLRERIGLIALRSQEIEHKPSVATIEWIDPIMAAGNWVPELIDMAGGVNLFGRAGKHSPWMEWDELWAANPDRIIVMPCGFDIATTRAEMPAIMQHPGWETLRAVREGHVYLTDGNHYFNRPGPRLVESLEILAEILHPDVFDFGHHGAGWVTLKAHESA